jgi:polar amino acid transport system substrate-binding protein
MKYKKIFSVALFCALIVPFIGNTVVATPDTSLADILDAEEIVIGTNAEYAPFESIDPVTDEIIGFDADIAQYIADDLGVDIVWEDVGFDTLVTSLATGTFDIVIAAMTASEVRKQQVNFTRWYFKSEQAVLVTLDNPKNITTIASVNSSAISVGVQAGTTSELYLTDSNYTSSTESYSSITLAIQALKQDSVDVVLGDHATLLNAMASEEGEFQVVDTYSSEDFGIAVPGGSEALLERLNSILDELLGTDLENPTPSKAYNDIFKEWMELDAVGYVEPESTIPGFSILGVIAAIPLGLFIIKRRKH